MAAAAHGADFPKAQQLRASMTTDQLRDFAATPREFLPQHTSSAVKVTQPRVRTPRATSGASVSGHPAKNLAHWLHPRKTR
ncbi:MAG TPA: hypothetical protein VKE96_12340 [Vicinamibacterales bacterium]|nr:hypothetical protein [Vicinamibacterales bacterium]